MKYMKLMKKILYSDMYHVEANGIAAIAFGYIDLAKNMALEGGFSSEIKARAELEEIAETIRAGIKVHEGHIERWSAKPAAPKTAQERRDEIVEQAKAAVAELKSQSGHNFDGIYYANAPNAPHVLEFVVNHEKRTVVALIKGKRSGRVYRKGIAKCAPDDCFNAHIGKAIALNRALGFPVPVKYLNAPQPTEVRVGDIIRTISDINVVRIIDDSRE